MTVHYNSVSINNGGIMLLPKFEFYEPASIKEAVELKNRFAGDARFLAGGTDLLVHLKKGLLNAAHVISLQKIKELSEITEDADSMTLGTCVTMVQLSRSELIQTRFPAIKCGADNMGTHLIRNRATIGGNVCNASPAGDTLPSLLVYKAAVLLESLDGSRQIPVEEFFKGPGKTAIKDNELLTGFKVPMPAKNSGAHYIQLGKRNSSEINVVNVASFLEFDPGTQKVLTARIALGSVAPTPIRSVKAEQTLMDKTIDETLFFEAGEAARHQDCKPIDDFRGSAAYRRAMIGVLTKRTLSTAYELAQSA